MAENLKLAQPDGTGGGGDRLRPILRQSPDQQAFLLALSDALRLLADAAEIQATTTRLLGTFLGADRSMYVEVEGALEAELGAVRGQYVRLANGGDPPIVPFPERFTYNPFGARTMARRSPRELLVVADVDADPTFEAAERAAWAAAGVRAAVVAPLVKGGRLVAELGVHSVTPRAWTTADAALVQDVAERTWSAVERARAEQTLRETEEQYRTLFDTMGEGYCALKVLRDVAGRAVDVRVLELNAAFERLSGLKRDQVLGRRLFEVFPLDDARGWMGIWAHVADTGEPTTVEDYVAPVDRWFETSAYRRGADRVVYFYRDITARKQAEIALTASKERQSFLLKLGDSLRAETDASAVVGTATRLLFDELHLDRCYTVTFRADGQGWDVGHDVHRPELPPMPAAFREDDCPPFVRLIAEQALVVDDTAAHPALTDRDRTAMQALGFGALVASSPRKDAGTPMWSLVAVSARPRTWTADQVILVEEVAERTWAAVERATAQAALRDSEARLRRILDSETVGVVFFDHAGTLLEANTAFWQMTGYTPADTRDEALSWRTVTPPEWVATREYNMEALAATGRVGPYEKEYQRKDGTRVWLMFAGRDLGDGTMVEFVIDVSERKRLEAERERLLVAEAVAIERQALLKHIVRAQEEERARVAREVHDSVTQLAHAAALHLDNAVEALDGTPMPARGEIERGRDLTRQVANQARRLIAELRPQVLDLAGLSGAIEAEAENLRRAGWEVEVLDSDLVGVRLDSEVEITLFRVAQEALSNIRKHAGATRVRVHLRRDRSNIRLEVRDSGHGFDPKAVRISAEGEHVGLTGMRERMHLVGGQLEIRSRPGGGATVRATLAIPSEPTTGI